jgi:hypothetical protein
MMSFYLCGSFDSLRKMMEFWPWNLSVEEMMESSSWNLPAERNDVYFPIRNLMCCQGMMTFSMEFACTVMNGPLFPHGIFMPEQSWNSLHGILIAES